jgi:hypothetical protein
MSLEALSITAAFDGGLSETVYSDGTFQSPYSDNSTVRPVTGGYDLELIRTGGWPGTTVELTIYALDSDGNHTVETINWNLPEPTPFGTGGLDGLQLSRVSASQVGIAPGVARCDDDTADIRVATALTVDITVSGAGGLDAGVESPDMWYSVWVISDANGAFPVAGLLSTSMPSPTLPVGYDHKRRVGWVRNDASSNLLHLYQRGNGRTRRIHYDEARTVLNVLTGGSATAFTEVDLSDLVPPGCDTAHLLCGFRAPPGIPIGTGSLELRPNGANSSDGPWSFPRPDGRRFLVTIATSLMRRIEYRVTVAAYEADVWVLGYDDEL